MLLSAPELARAEPPAAPAGKGASGEPAEGPSVVIWPTLTPAGDGPSPKPLRKPGEADKVLHERAQELDATLRDAVQDLGYRLYIADAGPTPGNTRDTDLLERASRSGPGQSSNTGTWVVSPRVELAGGDTVLVRLVVVAPNGHELRVRVESVPADSVAVRGLVMLRDLLSSTAAQSAKLEKEKERIDEGARAGVVNPLRSQGRAVLGVNAALFGGFAAYGLERASGSDDPRLVYPLLALGTGIGIGAALLVAEEWDVTTGNAWFLSAGAWWASASGVLIANGAHVQTVGDRYAYGVGGGLIGLGLATVVLARNRMDEGDAAVAHSGGALGMLWGGLGELALRGTIDRTPNTGLGYGAAIGLVTSGVLATRVTTTPSRVMLVDLGLGLGALAGAAIGSPLVFEDVTEGKARGFVAASLAGSVTGGVLALLLTRDRREPSVGRLRWTLPAAGVIGTSASREGAAPVYGLAWSGRW